MNIIAQLEANAQALRWSRQYLKGGTLHEACRNFINNRLQLRRLQYASSQKAGAAIFGISQVGKSYMTNYLLSTKDSPVKVYDTEGNGTAFLAHIDPMGNGREATALISRFSTSNLCGGNTNYPVRVRMMSLSDLVLVLVDSFYNDLTGHIVPNSEEIKKEIDRLQSKYGSLPTVQLHVGEEDIYELQEYFSSDLMRSCPDFHRDLVKEGYFETLSQIIEKIPTEDWSNVFGYLWLHNPIMTDVFVRLLVTLQKIEFSTTCYINIKALLNSKGTILHVDRIFELFNVENISGGNGSFTIEKASEPFMNVLTDKDHEINHIEKSAFCALAMEVGFTIANPAVPSHKQNLENEKPFLDTLDILDFPGARSREEIAIANLNKETASQMVIRGKVAYLFNKYSRQHLISTLLLCQDDRQAEVKTVPRLINTWVENAIGRTVEERTQFIRESKVSPLFVIATKFNNYLKKDYGGMDYDKMLKKWINLGSNLSSVLEIKGAGDGSWFQNWTHGQSFKNLFLLRSFFFSGNDHIFEGYKEENEMITSAESEIGTDYQEYLPKLKESFLDSDSSFVHSHFEDPKISWDAAVTPGFDGSHLIIEKLTLLKSHIDNARKMLHNRIINEAFKTLVNMLLNHYHDDNAALEMTKQRKTAVDMKMQLNVLFGKDKEFFTDFLDSLIINEAGLHNEILNAITSLQMVEKNNTDELLLIREQLGVSSELSYSENIQHAIEAIGVGTEEELEEYLKDYELPIEVLIPDSTISNISKMIADVVASYWFEHISVDNLQHLVDRGLPQSKLEIFLNNTKALFSKKLSISSRIANRIAPFVVGANSLEDLTPMLADISSQMVNNFITSMGAEYYDKKQWEEIESACAQIKLPTSSHKLEYGDVPFNEKDARNELREMFDAFDNGDLLQKKPQLASNYAESKKWTDLIQLSFLATAGIPTYDVAMNDALRDVIEKYITTVKALHDNCVANEKLRSLATIKISI